MKVRDIIRTSDTFENLIKILSEVKYHVVFVVDEEDKLVGIVTEGDIIKVLIPKYVTVDESLISVMDVNYFEKKMQRMQGFDNQRDYVKDDFLGT